MADNPLVSVHQCPKCSFQTKKLTKRLRVLSLSNTKISNWQSIENLESLSQLEELRLTNIPLLKGQKIDINFYLKMFYFLKIIQLKNVYIWLLGGFFL